MMKSDEDALETSGRTLPFSEGAQENHLAVSSDTYSNLSLLRLRLFLLFLLCFFYLSPTTE
jgi:hypothetical protein